MPMHCGISHDVDCLKCLNPHMYLFHDSGNTKVSKYRKESSLFTLVENDIYNSNLINIFL